MNRKNRILTAVAVMLLSGLVAVGMASCDTNTTEPETTAGEATVEVTEAPTEAPTEPVTEAPTDVSTEAPVADDTTAPAEDVTTAEAPDDKGGCGSVMGFGVAAVLMAAAVALKKEKRREGSEVGQDLT